MHWGKVMVSIIAALAATCAMLTPDRAIAQPCQAPNMLIILDVSTSMDGDIGGGITKWAAAKTAVQKITSKYGLASSINKIRFGLELFANPDAYYHDKCCGLFGIECSSCSGLFCSYCGSHSHTHVDDGECTVNAVNVGVADNNAAAVQNKINQSHVYPWSTTPIAGALNFANTYTALRDGTRANFVLLVTDGVDECDYYAGEYCTLCVNNTTALKNNGVKTFVVGFGSGVDTANLNDMATAGGTAKPGTTKYYQADNQTELETALDAISAQVASGDCTIPGKLGECAKGYKQCVGGQITCGAYQPGPLPETCDGKDNDCDGSIDNGVTPISCSSACGSGTQSCVNGQWTACNAPPANSCGTCSSTRACSTPCGNGTETCSNGQWVGCTAPGSNSCGACTNTRSCSTICGTGTETCVSGQWVNCTAQPPNSCGTCTNTRACSTICGTGTETCSGGSWINCTARKPVPETCNGFDDDCINGPDDGNPGGGLSCTAVEAQGECRNGTTACISGSVVCVAGQPSGEICDGLDNDCEGSVDNGLTRPCENACGKGTETCSAGQWGACSISEPTPEICNGLDEDCDGTPDNGDPGGGIPCSTGMPGVCAAGTTHCLGGQIECVLDQQPSAEICNGLDDDCDGTPDNGDPGGGMLCATGLPGECAAGTTHCLGGGIECIGNRQPSSEACNGLDDDCDGFIDNGARNACGKCGPLPVETCNGLDDDCDGKTDDGADCGPSKVCMNGDCVGSCINNECPRGLVCREINGEMYCVPPCNGVECPFGWECDPLSGECFDPCQGVQCGENQRCWGGKCIPKDCHESGCPAGYVCSTSGECIPDPCAGVNCDPDEQCVNGKCEPSCANISCPLWQRCVDGKCVGDPCDKVTCPEGKKCVDGSCVDDPCEQKQCGAGYICVDGTCVEDPCLKVKCPGGQVCVNGECRYVETGTDGGIVTDGSTDGAAPVDGSEVDGSTAKDGGTAADSGKTPDSGAQADAASGDDSGGGVRDAGGGAAESDSGLPAGCSCSAAGTGDGGTSLAALFAAVLAVLSTALFRHRRG